MKHQKLQRRIAAKGGSYTLAVTAVVLAILIAVNILASVLPTALTKLDISSTKLYSITSSTKVVVNNLEKDVTIYWVVQSDKEDEVIENLLGKYESLSSHITVTKRIRTSIRHSPHNIPTKMYRTTALSSSAARKAGIFPTTTFI